jgi:cell wall-associated NlpC family hydrolase
VDYAHAVLRQPAPSGIRTRLILVLSLSLVLAGLLPSPVSAGWLSSTWPAYEATPNSEAARVLEIAHEQLGDRFVMGAIGPDAFDCSGLVWYAFKNAGLADRMGGKRRGARSYLNWFKANLPKQVSHNLADARPGDILIWGGGHHSGLFIGGKWAISALNPRYDIRIHRADRVGLPFTAVLMVNISRTDEGSTPTPSPTPTPTATPATSASPSAAPSTAPAH